MAVSHYYQEYTTETEYNVIEVFYWGEKRSVPKGYDLYLAWCSAGNVPEKRSGSPFVTISDGKVIFDRVAALEAEKENKKGLLDFEYDPMFSNLSKAYMSALILGDTETITANRTAYQALLDEYNLKLEAIG